ncbi:lysine exporter LysO family protein [Pseudomonas lundensis]|uniref:lysine exporter LysO family protein n=1 Tax=Serratia proteamaculans TaxID=28151 RepID=UPI0029821C5C|nr:lysine exporter LysO family protein [Serratia proteamaculans]MDW5502871.1 lysine exporter LysO family protein [Serratia proteamaculans]MDW5507927.1 lysine exporter LysO family protein [Pseudomonas lundensis]
MYSGLLIILLPLIAGYLIPLRSRTLLQTINRMLSWMVYVILFFMGISLAFLEDLSSNLVLIFQYASVFFLCILAASLLMLVMLERKMPWHSSHKQEKLPSRVHMALESLKLCGVVLGGFLLGLTQWQWLQFANKGSEYALIFLLLLVGIQLRNSGMTLRQILLNRRGMMVAVVVVISSLAGGALAAQLLGLPIKAGLAMASGFGWYSLSGILITDAYGPVLGSAAFFNDLARELVAIMLIPTLVLRSRSSALGLCGATSMDFTLPVLQRSGGLEMVPPAIVHGFLLSLLAPVLIALFS